MIDPLHFFFFLLCSSSSSLRNTMKSILALIALAGAAVASPLRGNIMSPRFAEVGLPLPAHYAAALDTALCK